MMSLQAATETTNLCAEEPEVYASMKSELERFGEANSGACRTCGENDPAARKQARELGFWLPWLGDPPGASEVRADNGILTRAANLSHLPDHSILQ